MVNLIIKVISIVVLILPPAFLEAEASHQTYTIGFGSCITEKREQPIWKAIKQENIDEFFFMGDNVYGDSDDGLLIEMKESYKKPKKKSKNRVEKDRNQSTTNLQVFLLHVIT